MKKHIDKITTITCPVIWLNNIMLDKAISYKCNNLFACFSINNLTI